MASPAHGMAEPRLNTTNDNDAGPTGMTCALLLSRLGIPSRIIERRAAPQSAPAAHVVNARTFEIFRAAGVFQTAVGVRLEQHFAAAKHIELLRHDDVAQVLQVSHRV